MQKRAIHLTVAYDVYYVCNLQMFDVWLRMDVKHEANGIVSWCGTSSIKDERDPIFHFKIQGDNGKVGVRTGEAFRWKLVVIPSQNPKSPGESKVGFIHENNSRNRGDYIEEFFMECETGENTFHLVVEVHGRRCHLKLNDKLKLSEEDGIYPVIISTEYNPIRRAGLVGGVKFFIFEIGQKWYINTKTTSSIK